MSISKQASLTDYFEYHTTAHPSPVLSEADKGKAFATLFDLPNELLLCILDQLRWELGEYDCARRLYGVCRRFYILFAPKAFQSVVCHGTKAIQRLKTALLREEGLPADQVRHANFRYLSVNKITWSAVHSQLVPSLPLLPNLTMLTLQNIVVSVELAKALGKLPNLSFLNYDVPYPNSFLALTPEYGTFAIDELHQHPRRAPRRLQSLYVRFQAQDVDYLAFGILYSMIRASRETLHVINIDFNWCCGWMPVHKILGEEYPSLERLSLYHTNFSWDSLARFQNVHSEQLKHIGILYIGAHGPDGMENNGHFFLHELPALGHLNAPQFTLPSWQIDLFAMNLRQDRDSKISAVEMVMVHGRWEMLPYILKEHRHLRMLNMWDGQVTPVYNGTILHILYLVHNDLQSLEILRFNCSSRRGLDGRGRMNVRPLGAICDAERPNEWCRCIGCESKVYTVEERMQIRQEWEENEWHGYQDQIKMILPFFPKLRLVEWFLGGQVRHFANVPIPFWQWEVDRINEGKEESVKYRLKRTLNNWPPSNPFSEKILWSPTRGLGSFVH